MDNDGTKVIKTNTLTELAKRLAAVRKREREVLAKIKAAARREP